MSPLNAHDEIPPAPDSRRTETEAMSSHDLHEFTSLEVLADAALDRLERERDALAFAAAEGVAGAYERLALVELELDRRAERVAP